MAPLFEPKPIPRDEASLRASGKMHSSLAAALRSRPFPKMPSDIIAYRHTRAAHLSTLRHLMPVPGPIPDQVAEHEVTVPSTRDAYQIRCILYQPANPQLSSPLPLVVLYHAGSWSMGDLSDEEFNARLLCRDLGVAVLNVEYRLWPENAAFTWIDDAWDVLHAAATQPGLFGGCYDPRGGLVVGGSSAGGNIAAVMAHMARNRKLDPPVTGQWLSVPALIPRRHVPDRYRAEFLSATDNMDLDPVMGMGHWDDWDAVDLDSPLFSVVAPGNYPPSPEHGLGESAGKPRMAKALIQVAGIDPLRDDGLVYDRILREEFETETRTHMYAGFCHMFWANWPELQESQRFARDMVEGFRWLLE